MKIIPLTFLFCLLSHAAYAADEDQRSAHISAKDQVEITKIQAYLNGLRNIQADFIQIDDQGVSVTGKIAIARPGKMRVTYDPPSHDFIVADGSMVHIWNSDLKSQTNVEEGTSLAEFILRDPVRLNGEVVVTRFEHFPGKAELTLEQRSDPSAGSLTLIFEDRPLILRQWRVLDPEGHTIGVSLQNMRDDIQFPDSMFNFIAPNFGKGGKAEVR